jgi:hypothetical protein
MGSFHSSNILMLGRYPALQTIHSSVRRVQNRISAQDRCANDIAEGLHLKAVIVSEAGNSDAKCAITMHMEVD